MSRQVGQLLVPAELQGASLAASMPTGKAFAAAYQWPFTLASVSGKSTTLASVSGTASSSSVLQPWVPALRASMRHRSTIKGLCMEWGGQHGVHGVLGCKPRCTGCPASPAAATTSSSRRRCTDRIVGTGRGLRWRFVAKLHG
jgi:hypothetical protein